MLGAVRGLDGGDSDALIGGISFCGPKTGKKTEGAAYETHPKPPVSLFPQRFSRYWDQQKDW